MKLTFASAPAALEGKLGAGVANQIGQMLGLLRVEVFGVLEFLLGAFHGFFDRMLVDLFLGTGVLGEDGDLVAGDLSKATTDREVLEAGALGDDEFTVIHLRKQRDVAGEHADLALDRRDDNGVHRVGIDAGLGRDDFQGEWHGWDYFFAEAASTSSMEPFM